MVVKDCIETIPSWIGASACVAPVDAVCGRVSSGVWGCKFGPIDGNHPSPAPTTPDMEQATAPTPTWVVITPEPTAARTGAPTSTLTAPNVPSLAPYPSMPNKGAPSNTPTPTAPTPTLTVPDRPSQTETSYQPSKAPTPSPTKPATDNSGTYTSEQQIEQNEQQKQSDSSQSAEQLSTATTTALPARQPSVSVVLPLSSLVWALSLPSPDSQPTITARIVRLATTSRTTSWPLSRVLRNV
ncbi:hypothetical protein GN958_ATG07747 [Phytophthora infestans]|uniref:Uncharacterized protein n=1 Tax=Phytophthora infestans TaxID=4787 RepID=A0A8S9UQJ9_PHYIN|nr:hypothetical protein GN958_ATG07747 [Phytophthora infestans]